MPTRRVLFRLSISAALLLAWSACDDGQSDPDLTTDTRPDMKPIEDTGTERDLRDTSASDTGRSDSRQPDTGTTDTGVTFFDVPECDAVPIGVADAAEVTLPDLRPGPFDDITSDAVDASSDTTDDATDVSDTRDMGSDAPQSCTVASDCGADTTCARWSCIGGTCEREPLEGTCDDGLACTTKDSCSAGTCQGQPFSCSDAKYDCLSVTATAALGVSPGQTFELSFGLANADGWELVSIESGPDAPAVSVKSPTAFVGIADGCDTYRYRATWRDACGNEVSHDVGSVQVTATGGYVSPNTCDTTSQCGSLSNPWCELDDALANVATGEIFLTGTEHRHDERAALIDADVTIAGGYSDDFSTLDPDPERNGTRILSSGPNAFRVTNDAHLVLANLVLEHEAPSTVTTSSVTGVAVERGGVALRRTHLRMHPTQEIAASSVAIDFVAAGLGGQSASLPLSIQDSIVVAGDTDGSSGTLSAAVSVTSYTEAPLRIERSVLQGGAGETAYGVSADLKETMTVRVVDSSFEAGPATTTSVGLSLVGGVTGVEIDATNVVALGGLSPESIGGRIELEGNVTDSTFVGSLGESGTGLILDGAMVSSSEMVGALGVESATPEAPIGAAVGARVLSGMLTTSDVHGGYAGNPRTGAEVVGLESTLSGSRVDGSRIVTDAALVGVDASGGGNVLGNQRISGGAWFGTTARSTGVTVGVRAGDATIANNDLIVGCHPVCANVEGATDAMSVAIGIDSQPGEAEVTSNTKVLGGPWIRGTSDNAEPDPSNPMANANAASIGIRGDGLIVSETYVAGSETRCLAPDVAIGLDARPSSSVSRSFVRGGHANAMSIGMRADRGTHEDNTIVGGAAEMAIGIEAINSDLIANFVHTCGLDVASIDFQESGLEDIDGCITTVTAHALRNRGPSTAFGNAFLANAGTGAACVLIDPVYLEMGFSLCGTFGAEATGPAVHVSRPPDVPAPPPDAYATFTANIFHVENADETVAAVELGERSNELDFGFDANLFPPGPLLLRQTLADGTVTELDTIAELNAMSVSTPVSPPDGYPNLRLDPWPGADIPDLSYPSGLATLPCNHLVGRAPPATARRLDDSFADPLRGYEPGPVRCELSTKGDEGDWCFHRDGCRTMFCVPSECTESDACFDTLGCSVAPCNTGICTLGEIGSACSDDSHCVTGLWCSNEQCVECNTDADCVDTCIDGECRFQ